MLIADVFFNRLGRIIIRFYLNETMKLTKTNNLKTSSLRPKLQLINIKKARFGSFFKKSISHIIACSFDIFRSIFTNVNLFKVEICTKIKMSIPSYCGKQQPLPFGECLQNEPILIKTFDFDRQKVCMTPILTIDSILYASTYSLRNPLNSQIAVQLFWTGNQKMLKWQFS